MKTGDLFLVKKWRLIFSEEMKSGDLFLVVPRETIGLGKFRGFDGWRSVWLGMELCVVPHLWITKSGDQGYLLRKEVFLQNWGISHICRKIWTVWKWRGSYTAQTM